MPLRARGARGAGLAVWLAASCTFNGPPGAPIEDLPDAAAIDAAPLACASSPDYAPLAGGGPPLRFIDGDLQYNEAIAACAADDARLAAPTSVARVEAIAAELVRLDIATLDCFLDGPVTPCALVGLRQAGDAGDIGDRWESSDGAAFSGTDPAWRPTQPDDDDTSENSFENCAVIYTSEPAGLDDRPCSFFEYPAVCECAD